MADGIGVDRCNLVSTKLLIDLINGTNANEVDAMIVLENLTLGVMLTFRPDPLHAGEFMDSMTMAVIERMKPNG